MIRQTTPRIRCAIYTRKSTEEGLDQEFNTLDAQREAAEAYIDSQRMEGWAALPQHYDDGGYSGGNIDRPALSRLLDDVENHRVDCVMVYKVDRLSRSLLDFARIIEVFDRNNVAFVSVTQLFNTSNSMGRLVLNVLLSFAQFEREIIGERIRDKIAAAKRKGKFTGGTPVFGYDVDDYKTRLIVNSGEAKIVRDIYKRFMEIQSTIQIAAELNAKGITTKAWTTKDGSHRAGREWDKGHIYRMLHNPVYLGKIKHKDQVYPGEHEAIISEEMWERVHAAIKDNARDKAQIKRKSAPALLRGIIRCGHCEKAMTPVSTGTENKRYRYYHCIKAQKSGSSHCPVRSVPAGDIEEAVITQLRYIFRSPEMIAQTYRASKQLEMEEIESLQSEKQDIECRLSTMKESRDRLLQHDPDANAQIQRVSGEIQDMQRRLRDVSTDLLGMQSRMVSEQDVADALRKLGPIWDELYPVEQIRIVHLLVEEVTVTTDGMSIRMRTDGMHSLVAELNDKDNA
ncbi:MAG: recombinase family protein [Armatimonadota bacterium]